MARRLSAALIVLAACGGGGDSTQSDAAVDAANAKVVAVTCPSTPAATVTTTDSVDAFNPMMTTITQGQVVKFMLSPAHDAAPNPIGGNISDPGLTVGFGQTKCLMFTQTGTYGFFCTAHSFAGTVTVN